jgi:hypothetical protein
MSVRDLAAANFTRHLKQNAYPGRGLVVGRSSIETAWLMVYWIMGRSAHSRNRRFVIEDSTLRTEPVDLNQVVDPSLIIYDAMLELPGIYLVGNGDQVRTVYDALQTGGQFDDALATREREPDAPNYTPRISAMLDLNTSPVGLSLNVLKANPADPEATDRFTYRPATPPAGFGLCLTTYLGDGNPLPSFSGDPLLLPCEGTADQELDTYWRALDADNRLAIAVKHIPQDGRASTLMLHNRHESAIAP